jgi:hypothetical protein
MKKIIPSLLGAALAIFLFSQMDIAVAKELTGKELTGNEFLRMSEDFQSAYVLGFWAGSTVCCEVEELNNGKCNFQDLINVMDGFECNQTIDLLKKYLKDNPGERHKPIGLLFYNCLKDAAK